MTRPLTNKALVVLELLRAEGEHTCKDLAAKIEERTPCGVCGGSGEGDDSRWGCRKCYGRGRAFFDYSDGYTALENLRRRRLVSRRHVVDEWGDETTRLVYFALPIADEDELEQLYAAPAFTSGPESGVTGREGS